MNFGLVVLLAFGIGFVAGLRSLTAPAVVAWATHLGWLDLHNSPLAFMGTLWAVGDLHRCLPWLNWSLTNFRTHPRERLLLDFLPEWSWAHSVGRAWLLPQAARFGWAPLPGRSVDVAGAFGGYQARVGLVRTLGVADYAVAIPEDLVAIGLGLFLVSRF